MFPEDCAGDQQDWAKGVACAERPEPCMEHTGACCTLVDGTCADGVLRGQCGGPNQFWSKDVRCIDLACEPATGACCDHDPFGGCTEFVTLAECDCPRCGWTKFAFCDDIDCPLDSIPTVSAWGAALLALLLLIGAKLRFRASLAPTAR